MIETSPHTTAKAHISLARQPSRTDLFECRAADAFEMYLPLIAERYWPVLPLGTDCRIVLPGCRAAAEALMNLPLLAER